MSLNTFSLCALLYLYSELYSLWIYLLSEEWLGRFTSYSAKNKKPKP